MTVMASPLVLASAVMAQDWPFANAGGNYTVFEGDWVLLDASGSSGINGAPPQEYIWDLDNNGTFETWGYSVWFDATQRDGRQSQVVSLQVCTDGACDSDIATIDILNAPPTVNAEADVTLYSGETFSLGGIFSDPGVGDSHTAVVNFGDGIGNVPATVFEDGGAGIVAGDHQYLMPGAYSVHVCVSDDDGDTGCDTTNVRVEPVSMNIDIRPYNSTNSFNLESDDALEVAVLAGGAIDVSAINPSTITLASAPSISWPPYYYEDVNGDGLHDLVVSVWISEMQITRTATAATLNGVTYSGIHFTATDAIDIVPPRAPTPSWWAEYPTFSWSPVNGGICYQIQIDNNSDFSSPEQVSTIVEGTEYNAFPLADGLYYWRVRVGGLCVNVIQSGWSATRSFWVGE